MITDAIIGGFLAFLGGFLSLVPSWTLPTLPAFTFGQSIGNNVGVINRFFPLGDLFIQIAAGVVFAAGLFLWHLILFVYHQFWGSS